MARIVLWIAGGFWILFGIGGLLAPGEIVGGLGITLGSADALADARAMYGGAQIGIGLFFVHCARAEATWRTGLIALALISAGFMIARSFGIAYDGARAGITFFALATEITALALAGVALARGGAARQAAAA